MMPTRSRALLACGALIAAAALTGCSSSGAAGGVVSGRMILTLDDADIAPIAYANGSIVRPPEVSADTLTALHLPHTLGENAPAGGDGGGVAYAQLTVPNTMTAPPTCLAISADGRFAAVANPLIAPQGSAVATTIDALTQDDRVTLVELSGGGDAGPPALRTIDTTGVGQSPISVSFSPDGKTLAALCAGSDELVLVDITPDGFGDPRSFSLGPMIGAEASPRSVAWRPTGDIIAVTLPNAGAVVFFDVHTDKQGAVGLLTWGDPVMTGPGPRVGVWTPDGRYFLTADAPYGGRTDVNVVEASGTLSIIRVSDTIDLNGAPSHQKVGELRLSSMPTALAISPDGTLLAAASMRPSDLLPGFKEQPLGGTVTLARFDAKTGEATLVGETKTSALPTDLDFDARGAYLLVTDYANNEVQIWRARPGSTPALAYTGYNVGTGQGPHAVAVVR